MEFQRKIRSGFTEFHGSLVQFVGLKVFSEGYIFIYPKALPSPATILNMTAFIPYGLEMK